MDYRHKDCAKNWCRLFRPRALPMNGCWMPYLLPYGITLDSAFDEVLWRPRFSHWWRSNDLTTLYGGLSKWLLETKPFMKVLEIGTGSAYQAVVLAEMGVQVYNYHLKDRRSFFKTNKRIWFTQNTPRSNFSMEMALKAFSMPAVGYWLLLPRLKFRPNWWNSLKPVEWWWSLCGDSDVQQMRRPPRWRTALSGRSIWSFSFVPMAGDEVSSR